MQNIVSVPADQFPDLLKRLPAGLDLDRLARETKAIQRKRKIGDGASLLRLALARGPGGFSLRQTAGWVSLLGTGELSNPGVHYRLKQAVAFLAALVGLLLAAKAPGAKLRWPGRSIRLADGSCVSKLGSKGTDWRVHGVFDLGSGGFSHLELTDKHGGEAVDRGTLLAVKAPGANLRWPGRTLRLADGTCVSKPGSKGTDWRVHGVFDLGSGGFSHLELTDKHGAEALEGVTTRAVPRFTLHWT